MKTKILKYIFRSILVFSISIIALIFYVFYDLTSVVMFCPTDGIGNQLFRYSAAFSLAKETNSRLVVLIGSTKKKIYGIESNYNRHYELHKFNIQADEIYFSKHSVKGYLLKQLFKPEFLERANYVFSYLGRKIEFVNERNFFKLAKPSKNNIYLLQDTFESEIFFKKYSDELKQILTPIVTNPEKLAPYLAKLKKPKSFCVHVRRGDISNPSGIFYMPIDYQNKAIELAKQMVNDPYFYIFTDSPDLVKEELNDKHNIEFISSKELNSMDDFTLMSSCQNNIIANSTFSWWAAYLNPNPNKIVIAPNPRYSKELIDGISNDPIIREQKRELYTNQTYPDSWIKLNYKVLH